VRTGSSIFEGLAGPRRRAETTIAEVMRPHTLGPTTPMRYLLPTLWSQASVDLSTFRAAVIEYQRTRDSDYRAL
jgi:hypothetical protein